MCTQPRRDLVNQSELKMMKSVFIFYNNESKYMECFLHQCCYSFNNISSQHCPISIIFQLTKINLSIKQFKQIFAYFNYIKVEEEKNMNHQVVFLFSWWSCWSSCLVILEPNRPQTKKHEVMT